MELQFVDNPDMQRFEIRADGEIVGFIDYRLRDGTMALLHTQTENRFRHEGVGGRLVQSSLDFARQRHLAVLPYCPFVQSWIADHPAYADLVPADQRANFYL